MSYLFKAYYHLGRIIEARLRNFILKSLLNYIKDTILPQIILTFFTDFST